MVGMVGLLKEILCRRRGRGQTQIQGLSAVARKSMRGCGFVVKRETWSKRYGCGSFRTCQSALKDTLAQVERSGAGSHRTSCPGSALAVLEHAVDGVQELAHDRDADLKRLLSRER